MRQSVVLSFVLFLATSGPIIAATRLVPAEYPTIQSAIDDCNDGDEVVIATGTYTGEGNRDISFHGKAITVRSENGPENCIIDCQQLGRGFYFHNGEDANSINRWFYCHKWVYRGGCWNLLQI